MSEDQHREIFDAVLASLFPITECTPPPGNIKYYIDGALAYSGGYTIQDDDYGIRYFFNRGYSTGGSTERFDGFFSVTYCYDIALSADQIALNYRGLAPRFARTSPEPLPVEYKWLPFDPYLIANAGEIQKLRSAEIQPFVDVGFGMLGDFTAVVRFRKFTIDEFREEGGLNSGSNAAENSDAPQYLLDCRSADPEGFAMRLSRPQRYPFTFEVGFGGADTSASFPSVDSYTPPDWHATDQSFEWQTMVLTRSMSELNTLYVGEQATMASAVSDPSTWPVVLAKGNFGNINIGEAAFNEMFRNSQSHIARRECQDCTGTHQLIFYKRLTNVDSFNAFDYLANNWFSSNNNLNSDMQLFSTYEDAVSGNNPWQYCNYDDSGVGFPRDCGPTGYVGGQWNSWAGSGGQGNVRWSIDYQEPVRTAQSAGRGLTLGSISMWLNGREVARGSANQNERIGTPLDMTGKCVLGGSRWGNKFFGGYIDYVALYDRKLEDEELRKFTAVPPPPPSTDQCGKASRDQGIFMTPDGTKTVGSVEGMDDAQDLHFEAVAETVYFIHTEVESNSESLADTQIWLLDGDGNELAYNDDYPYEDSLANRSKLETPAFAINEEECGGACNNGPGYWSDGTITYAGSAGFVHGPWGNNVRDVVRTIPIPQGVTSCTVSWRSWSADSRDNEWDHVNVNGVQVWAQQAHYTCPAPWITCHYVNGNPSAWCDDWPFQHSNYATCYIDQTVEVDCSQGSVHLHFNSQIDQGFSNEKWAFSNVKIGLIGGVDTEEETVPVPYIDETRTRKSWSSMIVWRAPASDVFTVRVKGGYGGTPLPLRRTVSREGLFRVQVTTTDPILFTAGIPLEDLVVGHDEVLVLDTSQVVLVNSLTVMADGLVMAKGAAALVIMSKSSITIDGSIDVSGRDGSAGVDSVCAGGGGGGGGAVRLSAAAIVVSPTGSITANGGNGGNSQADDVSESKCGVGGTAVAGGGQGGRGRSHGGSAIGRAQAGYGPGGGTGGETRGNAYPAGGGGAGYGADGSNGFCGEEACSASGGSAYGDPEVTTLHGGSGGGGGGDGAGARESGGGGGSGGSIVLEAGSIVMRGTMSAIGGTGGLDVSE